MRRTKLILPLALALTTVIAIACDDFDFTDFEGTIDTALDLGPGVYDTFAQSPDPAVQAAGQTGKATQRERDKAGQDPLSPEGLMNGVLDDLRDAELGTGDDALDPLSPDGLADDMFDDLASLNLGSDPATAAAQAQVDADPTDGFTRLNLAVAQVAAGAPSDTARREALGLYMKFGTPGPDPSREWLSDYLLLLGAGVQASDPGTNEHGRLLTEYCRHARLMEKLDDSLRVTNGC